MVLRHAMEPKADSGTRQTSLRASSLPPTMGKRTSAAESRSAVMVFMRDDIETAVSPAAAPAANVIRGEDGILREEFIDSVRDAVEKGRTETLRSLICDLHEADVGSVIEALDPDLRPRLVELMGP